MRIFHTKLIDSIQHLDTIRLSPLYPYNRWSTKLSRQVLLHVRYDLTQKRLVLGPLLLLMLRFARPAVKETQRPLWLGLVLKLSSIKLPLLNLRYACRFLKKAKWKLKSFFLIQRKPSDPMTSSFSNICFLPSTRPKETDVFQNVTCWGCNSKLAFSVTASDMFGWKVDPKKKMPFFKKINLNTTNTRER